MDDDLTPTESLIVDLLIARLRMGEMMWTFTDEHTRALRRLDKKGIITLDSGPIEKTYRASLTQRFLIGEGRGYLSLGYSTHSGSPLTQKAAAQLIEILDTDSALGDHVAAMHLLTIYISGELDERVRGHVELDIQKQDTCPVLTMTVSVRRAGTMFQVAYDDTKDVENPEAFRATIGDLAIGQVASNITRIITRALS